MNSEELKKEFGLLMPSEINGFKRPDESIPSSNDFFLEIPQLISKDPVLYSTMNLIFSVILSNDKLLKQWIDTLQNVVNAQDWRVVTDSLKGYMTPELKKKLDGIANGANNYVHPSSHPASMIAQDATHRFVSDTEKNTWNAKASTAVVSTTANGLAPKRDGNASHFLAGDGTWKVVPSASSATSATKATQDSRGQQIDTTYIKSITASNATLTLTKGNGTTSTVTINNVAHATKADDATNAGNINKGYAEYAEKFPADTFRNDVLGREGNGFALRPFYCLLPNGKYGSSPGVGFGSIDTQGFLQVAYNAPIAYVGAGNEGKIKWSKQLAFTDSPTLTGTPTAPTQNTSDNSTRIATTAFVKSLFTASKATNGWWKDGNTGIIYQWGVNNINSTSKSFNFNISFPNSCFIVRAGDIGIGARSVGSKVKDNASFTIYTDDSSKLVFSWFAVGY